MKDLIRIATRQSKLALWQAEFIRERLREAHADLEVEFVGITTRGDKWLSSPLSEMGGKGLFIKELEEALLDGRADLAVHSMKDVPAVLPESFVIPLIGYREDVRDALVSRHGGFMELPQGAVVGSSSMRRQAQMLARRKDLRVTSIRGNVDTRLAKLDAGEFDAIVLASAGLNRLGLGERVTERFEIADMLPAGGQGALGIECARDNAGVLDLLKPLEDAATRERVLAERGVAAGLGADCTMPLGACAVAVNGALRLEAMLASPDGVKIIRAATCAESAAEASGRVVEDLLSQGAAAMLEALPG